MADFAQCYGIRLGRGDALSWREFYPLLVGLMAADTRIYRRFAPEPETT